MDKVELLRSKIKRLKKSQAEAEDLLEEKSRELYELNKNLEAQIIERTKELEKTRDEAVEANKAKSQFLANMSHEIRTPLNGMLGFLGILQKSNMTEAQANQVSIVKKSGELLLNIINDILDLSKIEADKIELEEGHFHLKRCIEDILDVMSHQIYDKGLEFSVYIDESLPKKLVGDESRLRQVLINLIGNAIKFTPSGEIRVNVYSEQTNDSHFRILFEVEDTGIGIAQDKLHGIFEAFEQADVSDTRKYGGTGLGLTISQQIVRAMQGELEVISREGEGSKFFFTLSLEAPEGDKVEFSNRSFDLKEETLVCVPSQSVRNNLIKRLQSWKVQTGICKDWKNCHWSYKDCSKNIIIDSVYINHKDAQPIKDLIAKDINVMIIAPPKEVSLLGKEFKDIKVKILSKPVKREDLFNALAKSSEGSEDVIVVDVGSKEEKDSLKNLLLVEDNWANQQVALAMLEIHGYSLDIANNGQEAVDMFDPKKHGLILMDCQMPVMDGFDATKIIKEKYPQTIIIAMTANAFKKTKEQCFESGMDDFITKPVNDELLAEMIHKNLVKKEKSA